jgi:site-specific recombinase XerC
VVRATKREPTKRLVSSPSEPFGNLARQIPPPSKTSPNDTVEGPAAIAARTEGKVLRVSTYRKRVFTPAVERLRATDRTFPKVSPHDLRHTAASLAIGAGANPKAVQAMLGHKSAAMTLDTYSDLFPDDLEVVSDRLDVAARSAIAAAADALRTGTENGLSG